jgi:hypothetical protein
MLKLITRRVTLEGGSAPPIGGTAISSAAVKTLTSNPSRFARTEEVSQARAFL